jgi:hypothetical protein
MECHERLVKRERESSVRDERKGEIPTKL